MTGEDLKLSGTRADFDTSPGAASPIVTMEFTGKGRTSSRRSRATSGSAASCVERRRSTSRSSSTARSRRSRRSTSRTRASRAASAAAGRQIQGLDSLGEAKDIALVLQTGALPVKFETLDRTDISATLGKDSLQRGVERRDRRPDPRRDLPADLLPLPRSRRGRAGSRSTRHSCTRRSSSSTSR